jgi:hypothetical protein
MKISETFELPYDFVNNAMFATMGEGGTFDDFIERLQEKNKKIQRLD